MNAPRIELPPAIVALLEAVRAAGGRAWLVGGAVRDAILGRTLTDYDIEVYGLEAERLRAVVSHLGRVDEVGQAFTVLKLTNLPGVSGAVDVALPRRDSKVGPGHRGIAAVGDPHLPMEIAARRRDFTMNAILLDPLTGELEDPCGGRGDIEAGILRAADTRSFGEDPLRALRAVQLAARYSLDVDPGTASLCASMALAELPRERVFGEVEKLLLKAPRPSRGLTILRAWGMLGVVAPELLPLADTQQEPDWHPEGNVWLHTLQVVDEATAFRADLDSPRALTLMLAGLCHDLGKPATTCLEEGRIRSRGHEEAGVAPTLSLLDRWGVHSFLGYDVRSQVVALVRHHLKPGELHKVRDQVGDGAIRRLARRVEPELLARVAKADTLGRKPGIFDTEAMDWFLAKARALDVGQGPAAPILLGRHVLALGVPPGPTVGVITRAVYERQLDGFVTDLESAVAEGRRMLDEKGPGGTREAQPESSRPGPRFSSKGS